MRVVLLIIPLQGSWSRIQSHTNRKSKAHPLCGAPSPSSAADLRVHVVLTDLIWKPLTLSFCLDGCEQHSYQFESLCTLSVIGFLSCDRRSEWSGWYTGQKKAQFLGVLSSQHARVRNNHLPYLDPIFLHIFVVDFDEKYFICSLENRWHKRIYCPPVAVLHHDGPTGMTFFESCGYWQRHQHENSGITSMY